MITEEQRAEIRRLFHAEHWKVGTIARELDLHHDTVRRALEVDRFVSNSAVRPSALDPYVELVRDTLEQHPRLTATRVLEMIRSRGYAGSAGQLRRRIRQLGLRPKPSAEAYLRLSTVPGEQGQVDWAHFGRLRVGRSERPLYFFVVVLSWSRAFFVDFSYDQTVAAVVRGHRRAFEDLGGVPRTLLYDNMKTVVLERAGDAFRFHPRLLELAGHYHFAPRPCRPGRGNEKGRVERRIRDLRCSFFAARRFHDLDDLRQQFLSWRKEVAYQRPCPGRPEITVAQALEQEREHLLSLPEHPIDGQELKAFVARKQPYVIFDSNRYSIPHEQVGRPLTLAVDDRRLRVLDGDELVAQHQRCWDRHQVIEQPEHLEGLRKTKRAGRGSSGRARLLDFVPEAEPLYAALAARGEPLGPCTQHLLLLLDRHGADVLRDAVVEALDRNTPRPSSVEHIIAQRERATRRKPAVPLTLPDHSGVRDLRTRTHRLEDYDALGRHRDPQP